MLLLKNLWSGLRVPNRIRLVVFGSLYLRDTARNLCGIERRWLEQNVRKTLCRIIIAALKWTPLTTVFIGNNKTKWGKVIVLHTFDAYGKIFWQNYLGVMRQTRKATTPFEAWNYLITDEILDNIFLHTKRHILIQPNFSRASDAKLRGQIEIKAFFGLLYWAGALRINKPFLEELWSTDGNGIETFGLGYWWRWNWNIWLGVLMEMELKHLAWGADGDGIETFGLGYWRRWNWNIWLSDESEML
jgi:hypothetical protein